MITVRRLSALALGLLVLLPGTARADDPVIVDKPGEVVPPLVCLSGTVETCSTTDPVSGQLNALIGPAPEHEIVEPSVDILEGALTTTANELVLSLTVLDVDHPGRFGADRTSHLYEFYGKAQGLAVVASLHRQPGRPDVAKLIVTDGRTYPYATRSLFAEVDTSANTVTWRVPLALLADAGAESCPTCAPLGRGTVLSGIKAGSVAYTNAVLVTEMSYSRDQAAGSRDYTNGDR